MLELNQLAALAAVHREGSFELAAKSLHVTSSAISQRIKALEESIGSLLIVRGQPCKATTTGLRLVRHFEDVSLLEQGLVHDIETLVPEKAALRIAVNADSLATWFLPALAETPGFLYDIVIDDEGHSQEWLKQGTVAAAVTSVAKPLQGCDRIELGSLRYVAAASPDYMKKWMPNGATLDAIRQAPALSFSEKDMLQVEWVNRFSGGRLTKSTLLHHRIGSTQGFVDACLLGLGWALHPSGLIKEHLRKGALVELAKAKPLDVKLYWQYSRVTAEPLKKLTNEVKKAARKSLI